MCTAYAFVVGHRHLVLLQPKILWAHKVVSVVNSLSFPRRRNAANLELGGPAHSRPSMPTLKPDRQMADIQIANTFFFGNNRFLHVPHFQIMSLKYLVSNEYVSGAS